MSSYSISACNLLYSKNWPTYPIEIRASTISFTCIARIGDLSWNTIGNFHTVLMALIHFFKILQLNTHFNNTTEYLTIFIPNSDIMGTHGIEQCCISTIQNAVGSGRLHPRCRRYLAISTKQRCLTSTGATSRQTRWNIRLVFDSLHYIHYFLTSP